MLECLDLRPEFGLYESLLRDAARALAGVDDERIARVRGIDREGRGLVVLAPLVPGQRLEELLEARSADEYAGPGIDAALGFLVQALPAVAVLHGAGLVHGTIAPGRIALSPSGQVVFLDCIYAAAVDRLRLNRQALWSTLAIVAPVTIGAGCDRTSDLRQVALAALAIALGRPLHDAYKPDVVARLLQEVTEVAQIRGGERFAVDLRSLLGAASGPPTGSSIEQVTSEAKRLARSLGADTCLAALTELARFQVYPVEASAHPAPRPAPLAAPIAEPFLEPEPVAPAPANLSLDLSESVEISFDGLEEPEILELELPTEDDALVLSLTPTMPAHGFDWEPDAGGVQAEQTPAVVSKTMEVTARVDFDWAPEPPPAPDPAVIAEPRELGATDDTAQHGEMPVTVLQAQPDPPVPPPGIPLFRSPAAHATPPAPAETPPAPPPAPMAPTPPGPKIQEERSGMKVYTPPPAPVAVAAPAPQPIQFAAAPHSVTVVVAPAAAVQPSPTLRLKTDEPTHYARPRGILTDAGPDGSAHIPLGRAGERRSGGVAWKVVAAAGVVLAIGAFAGRPYLDGQTEAPAATEAAAAPAPAVTAPASTGGLRIETQPTGAAVLLNGEDVGRTPLELDDVKPGRHVVTLSTDSTTVRRTVRIEAGKVVTLDVPVYSGWVAIYSPVPLHVSEGGQSLGTTETTRVMLSPGRHELTLTNRELGYSAKQTVEIVPGEERVLNLEPKGTVNVNALPWAEVWIDGIRMGETPLANLEVPLGTREFVFKHPTHGERRITTVITSKAPPISVDFTKPGTRP